MSYVQCDVLYRQLLTLIDKGYDLSNYKVADCDEFAGEAIIVPLEDDDDE